MEPIIVIDVDQTLVDVSSPLESQYQIRLGKSIANLHIRPHAKKFIAEVFKKYKRVIIWSFGNAAYIKQVIPIIKPDQCEFEAVYCGDRPPFGKQPDDNTKNLKYIDSTHGGLSFIVDDNLFNSKYNIQRAITIRPFYYGMDPRDECLLTALKTLDFRISEFYNPENYNE